MKETQPAKKYEELGTLVFKNNKFKTSLRYRAKVILVPTLTDYHIQLYVKYLRPTLILDSHKALRDRHLFAFSKNDETKNTSTMIQSLVTTHFSKCFERAGVFEGKPELYKRVSRSRIRFAIIRELVTLGEDSLDSLHTATVSIGWKCAKNIMSNFIRIGKRQSCLGEDINTVEP